MFSMHILQGDDNLIQLNKHLCDTEHRFVHCSMQRGHSDHKKAIDKIQGAKRNMKELLMVYSIMNFKIFFSSKK